MLLCWYIYEHSRGSYLPLTDTRTNALVVNLSPIFQLYASLGRRLCQTFRSERIACGEANASGDINLMDRRPLETLCSQVLLILQKKNIYAFSSFFNLR